MLPARLMEEIAADEVLEEAYRWVCDRRKKCSPNNDIWTLRWKWARVKPELQELLVGGNYWFDALYRVADSRDRVELWSARDALVLKAMTIVLSRHLNPLVPKTCYQVLGNGGAKRAVSDVVRQLAGHTFVFRSDVKGYYASIDHDILVAQLRRHIADERVIRLVWQYLRRTVYDSGRYEEVKHGIPLGCPLSPLMGCLYLAPLDERMIRPGVFYVRFADDWIVLARSRWKLRAAVRTVNRALAELKIRQHPGKTFVGLVSRGFEFLGYRLSPAGIVGIAEESVQRCIENIGRLYERGADSDRIGQYVRNWWTWVKGGIDCGFGDGFPAAFADVPGARDAPLLQMGCESALQNRGGLRRQPTKSTPHAPSINSTRVLGSGIAVSPTKLTTSPSANAWLASVRP